MWLMPSKLVLLLSLWPSLLPALSWNAASQSHAADLQRETAISLEQQGKTAEAEEAWKALSQQQPSNAEAFAHLGFLAARREHYGEAVPLYRRALALQPAMPGLALNLGLSLFKSGQFKEAVQVFAPLLQEASPESPEAKRLTTLIGLADYGQSAFAEAVPYLKKAAAYDSQNLAFRLALAQSCLGSKQYPCVLDVYHEILLLNAESAEADMLAGEAMDEMRDHAGAIEQFRAAVKADPKAPNAHFGLGYLLWTQMQYEEAAQSFQAELEHDPNHAQALAYLGDTNIRLNHPEAAQPVLAKAVQLDQNNELAHLDLGILAADAGKKDEALRQFQEATRLSPDDVSAHLHLGRLYKAMGRKDEAKLEFDKTSSLTKANHDSVFTKLENARARGPQSDVTTPQTHAPEF